MSDLELWQHVVRHVLVSEPESEYLDLLVRALVVLDTSADDSVAIASKQDLICRLFELKRSNESIESLLKSLQTSVRTIEEKISDSVRESKSHSAFEKQIAEKIRFYSNKSKEYYSSVKTQEKSLSQMGFTSDLSHKSMEALREETKRLESRLNEVNQKLNTFSDFKPTESDLKNRINEMQTEMTELDDKYFNDKL